MPSLITRLVGILTIPLVAGFPQTWDWCLGSCTIACPVPIEESIDVELPTPFKPLSQDELDSLVELLRVDLGLPDPSEVDLEVSSNYIWHLEELKPNKSAVLEYLSVGNTVPRYARAVVVEAEAGFITEYYVGPLPISENTKILPLDYFYNGADGASVGIDARFDPVFESAKEEYVTERLSNMADITERLLNMSYYGAGDERTTAENRFTAPTSRDGKQSVAWSVLRRKGLAPSVQPTDFYIGWDFSGTDPSQWNLNQLVYNDIVYSDENAIRMALDNGEVERRPLLTTDESWIRKNRKGDSRDLDDRMAPTVVETEGKRYKVDNENRYVEYLGWAFYTRFDRDIGIQFYDIRLKGERIMYELSLQDAIAQYSGNNPFEAATAYLDRASGMGLCAGRLIPGYDCPYHATYWNSTFSSGNRHLTNQATICIFESDIGAPITRRTDTSFMQATKGSKLVVRQISTMGNYEYLWDYSFWVDGTITIDARASGYLQATYYRPEDEGKWGPRIQESISGTLHTHVMNFKADFDLLGTANTLLKTDLVVKTVSQEWFKELGDFEIMQYETTEVQSEKDSVLPVPENAQSMYTIVNKEHKNKWGEYRGYRIVPGVNNVHLPSMKSPFLLKSGQLAKQAFAVTRQHDSEQASSAALNQNLPEAPLVDFTEFFDEESLVQEDLVAWVNLGMHHFTRSEDIPNTLMAEAHSSIMFAPHNWGDAEGTVDLRNAVIYEKENRGGTVEPQTNGVDPPDCFPLGDQDMLSGVFEQLAIPSSFGRVEEWDMTPDEADGVAI